MKIQEGLPEPGWDKLIAAQKGHFIQTRAWAEFQETAGRQVLSASGDGWSWLGTLRQASGFRYLYVGYGPTVEQGALKPALESLLEATRAYRCAFVRFEPLGNVATENMRQSGLKMRQIEEIEPAMTSVINLSRDEEGLRHQLSSGHRSAINGADRRGISFRHSIDRADVMEFISLMDQTARKAGIRVHEAHYFETMLEVLGRARKAKLYLAEAEGKVIAADIIYTDTGTWYYAHAASDPAYLKLQAGVPLLWQAILDAKAAGAKSFDLWGVIPLDETHGGKAGYSRFKRAFGGEDRVHVGTWDLVVRPQLYAAYRVGRAAARLSRAVRRG